MKKNIIALITLKRLYLLDICSISARGYHAPEIKCVNRPGIVVRCEHPTDKRASLLAISPAIVKLLSKYGICGLLDGCIWGGAFQVGAACRNRSGRNKWG